MALRRPDLTLPKLHRMIHQVPALHWKLDVFVFSSSALCIFFKYLIKLLNKYDILTLIK